MTRRYSGRDSLVWKELFPIVRDAEKLGSTASQAREIVHKVFDLFVCRFGRQRRHLVVLAGFEALDQLQQLVREQFVANVG